MPEVETPPVDFQAVARRIQSVIDTIQEHDSEERFCGLGARVMFGEPVFVDEHTVSLDGRDYSAKSWVIATGSSPAVPPIEGLDRTLYITNREIFSLDHLPQSMMVLGAGPIAIEMAQAFCRLGTKVTVVQRSGQILSKEDKDMADTVMEVLKREGVEFHLNAAAKSVRDLGSEREMTITDAEGNEQKLIAETLARCPGARPQHTRSGAGLHRSGVLQKGLAVDDRLRTSQKHIYAAGDVTGSYLFTHAAGYEGGIVVSNAIFHLPRKADYTFCPGAPTPSRSWPPSA